MTGFLGVDVGTSAAKAAAFDADGRVLATARHRLPPLESDGARVWQPLDAVLRAADAALRGVAGEADLVALTTQRDTLVLLGENGAPLTELISWRDRRDAGGSLWEALARDAPELLARTRAVRSLASLLTERWTGRAAETAGTLPRQLVGPGADELERLAGGPVDLPAVLGVGAAVAPLRDPVAGSGPDAGPSGVGPDARDDVHLAAVPLHVTSGDKNCELLGNGVTGPGRAGLSLGSAISLGVLAEGRPEGGAGYVVTPGALDGRWNVETGLVVGMEGLDTLTDLLGNDPTLRAAFMDVPVFLPHFAGALDRPDAVAAIHGLRLDTTPAALCQAWAQGVVCELRRLFPRVQRAAGTAVAEIVVSGGGADPAWGGLVAGGLGLPVRRLDDAFRGARGAVACALAATRPGALDRFMAGGEAALPALLAPAQGGRRAAERYCGAYETLFCAGTDGD